MLDQVFKQVIEKFVEYCEVEENRKVLETFVGPMETFVAARFAWVTRCFEVIACLAVVQTILLLIILYFIMRLPSRQTI